MPSKSYIDFLELLVDVDKLFETYHSISNGKVGRKNLGFLTRSATVMLCAAWERYNENLLLECIDIILVSEIKANELPMDVKKFISKKIKENKNEISPIELADTGWRNLWKGYATNETEMLHTPNSANLNQLFKRFLGLADFTELWEKKSKEKIDSFIKTRGEIAHNGSKSKYVRMNSLKTNYDLIIDNSIEIDYNISQVLKKEYDLATWDEEYFRSLEGYKK